MEDNKKELRIEIDSLAKAKNYIEKALNELRDVEDYSEEDYAKLNEMAEKINDLKIDKEIELNRLEEE